MAISSNGNNTQGNKRNNRGRGRGGRGRGRGTYNPRQGNQHDNAPGRNQGQQQAKVGAVESQPLDSPNQEQTHTQQESPNQQEAPARVEALEFLNFFPHPNQF